MMVMQSFMRINQGALGWFHGTTRRRRSRRAYPRSRSRRTCLIPRTRDEHHVSQTVSREALGLEGTGVTTVYGGFTLRPVVRGGCIENSNYTAHGREESTIGSALLFAIS